MSAGCSATARVSSGTARAALCWGGGGPRGGCLVLAGVGDAEVELRDRNCRLGGGHLLEQRDRAREGTVLDGDDGIVERIGDRNPVFRIDAGHRHAAGP